MSLPLSMPSLFCKVIQIYHSLLSPCVNTLMNTIRGFRVKIQLLRNLCILPMLCPHIQNIVAEVLPLCHCTCQVIYSEDNSSPAFLFTSTISSSYSHLQDPSCLTRCIRVASAHREKGVQPHTPLSKTRVVLHVPYALLACVNNGVKLSDCYLASDPSHVLILQEEEKNQISFAKQSNWSYLISNRNLASLKQHLSYQDCHASRHEEVCVLSNFYGKQVIFLLEFTLQLYGYNHPALLDVNQRFRIHFV